MQPIKPSDMDVFMFDLKGYLILKKALEPELLDTLNKEFDAFPDIERGQWYRNAQRRDYTDTVGYELHQCVEVGGPFERLIDHPSWIEYARLFCGTGDAMTNRLFVDETVATARGPGGHHPVHAGGYQVTLRNGYNYVHGVFRCGQINIIAALTDVGPGDGPTMLIPGSHKSNFPHPHADQYDYARGDRMDDLEGAEPAYMEAGDALLFVDAVMHGGASRTNPGERRIVLTRYGPSFGGTRYGYRYSQELIDRLTPARRAILQPVAPVLLGDTHCYPK